MQPDLLQRSLCYNAPAPVEYIEARVALQLPYDFPASAQSVTQSGLLVVPLAQVPGMYLDDQDLDHPVDLSTRLLVAFCVFLSRYTREEVVRLDLPVVHMPGAYNQTIPDRSAASMAINVDLSSSPTCRTLLQQVEATLHTRQEQRILTAPDSAESCRSIHFTYQRVVQRYAPVYLEQCPHLDGDLRLDLVETSRGIEARWMYHPRRFSAATIRRMHTHFQTLLASIAAHPGWPVSQLPLMTAAEQQRVLALGQNQVPHALTMCVHELVAAQAEHNPAALAVADAYKQLTYHELNRRSNQIAHYLHARGVQPETLVAVCMERSVDFIVACLGILKAGAAYVPLDPGYPVEHLAFMLEDAAVPILLTQERFAASLQSYVPHSVCLDSDWPAFARMPAENPLDQTALSQLAYVIYTSGSTGRPKGVQIEHQGLLNLVGWHQHAFRISAADRTTQLAGLAFDAAVWEIWPSLCAGASITIPDAGTRLEPVRLRDWLLEQGITICFLPTPLAEQVIDLAWPTEAPLRLLLTGGDQLTRRPRAELPFILINNYGPTENTVVSTSGPVLPFSDKQDLPDIGRPINNVQTYILDPALQPVPIGVPGELCVQGIGLARGYLNRPELTREKFLPDPFSSDPDARIYRTGDLVRYRAEGTIEFLGRIDQQVKVRGFRIEPGEIEAVLEQHALVDDVVVLAIPTYEQASSEKRLVAYIVPTTAEHCDRAALATELQVFLQPKLPEHMHPSAFVLLETLPLTPNGKVDRRALAALPVATSPSEPGAAPRTAEEAVLAEIWASVLNRKQIGIHDDFFALGGHSLLAARALMLVNNTLERNIPLQVLFEAPTVAAFARAIHHTAPAQRMTAADLAAEVVLPAAIMPPAGSQQHCDPSPQAIFLTGATGFLGAFLLQALLTHTNATIYCLVRAAHDQEAGQRIQHTLASYQIWPADWRSRVVPVAGDLRQPLLGLSPQRFQSLAHLIDVIYHAGAYVKYLYPYSTLKAANVQGSIEILRLACQEKLKPVHFVSTLAVAAEGHNVHIYEQDDLPACTSTMGYHQSKWVAEGIMHLARARGIPVAIYRPGRIGSHSQAGTVNPGDFFVRLLAGCFQLGLAPAVPMVENFIPVDFTAQAIVHLSQQPASLNKTFHLLNPQPTGWFWAIDRARESGYSLQLVSYAEWYAALLQAIQTNPDHLLNTLLPFIPPAHQAAPWINNLYQQAAGGTWSLSQSLEAAAQIDSLANQSFDTQYTDAGLASGDIRCPAIDAPLFKRMLAAGTRQGLFPEPECSNHAILKATLV